MHSLDTRTPTTTTNNNRHTPHTTTKKEKNAVSKIKHDEGKKDAKEMTSSGMHAMTEWMGKGIKIIIHGWIKKRRPTTPGVPVRSPITVLTQPDCA